MACSVLAPVRLWTAAFVLVVAPFAAFASAAEQDCSAHPGTVPSSAEPQIRSLQERLRAGPFYRELLLEFGKPLSCNVEFEDGSIGLTYEFRNRAQLTARIDLTIEISEQKMQTPRMKMTKAIALLKAAERDAYRPNGCGIAWDHAADESFSAADNTHETVYRGTACNCQARVTSRKNYAVSLVLKSAC